MENLDLDYIKAEVDAILKLMETWNKEHPEKSMQCIPAATIDRLKNLQKYFSDDKKPKPKRKESETQ